MRKMKVLVFALLMARPTHGSDDHAEIVVPFSEDVKTVSSISTVTLKTLTLTWHLHKYYYSRSSYNAKT